MKNSQEVDNNNNNNNNNKVQVIQYPMELKKKKTVEHETDAYTNCNRALGTVTKGLVQGLEDLEITRQVETVLYK